MTIVSNSGPIIHLSMGGQIALLPQLFGEVWVPRIVYQEVVDNGNGLPGSQELRNASWARVADQVDPSQVATFAAEQLDPGEAHALALAVTLRASLLLLDDRAARHVADRSGIPMMGTLGILLTALQAGAIARIAPVLNQMKLQGFWLSPRLERDILERVGELPP